jgi:hypothetical protein
VYFTTIFAVLPDGINRRLANGHDSLTAPLPIESNASIFQIRSIKIKRNDLADSSTRPVQGLA